jgi:hypothetical protein|tara:strand:- start:8725 stop:8913 length:189 start_codon:yes stop_codon:yes gene_type:complete
MVMSFGLANSGFPVLGDTLRNKPKGPTFGELSAQAKRALSADDGIDVTGMSREERAKSFFGD